ncbi:MAG: hypothetical protein H8M99_05255 [Gloeobacteraceae cyanobacterium ES-bin-144]|nr:hypothetical protein [Verrucomicrobiales bacterium]
MADPEKKRLSKEQRDEATRRVLAGEKASALGKEYGVSRAYITYLKANAVKPEHFKRKAEKMLTRKLTEAEAETFQQIIASRTPEDLDLIPHSEKWTLDHGRQLALRLFKKELSARALTDYVSPYMPRREDFRFTKPQPPKPHHINQISPEFANDPDYVAYYLSPICEQIAWREYEWALADWNKRFADKEESVEENESAAAQESVFLPGRRIGKHAKSKGSPFTPPKRRKRRR